MAETAATTIWGIFQQLDKPADRKNIKRVTLLVESIDEVAHTTGDQIHLSAKCIHYHLGDLRREVTGIICHEITHVWQWNGNGQAPSGLIKGIADYVRMQAGHWVKPGEGDRWV
ncbi:hypothetical protein Ancab_017063 [Ancistrocladus abbreviatus]